MDRKYTIRIIVTPILFASAIILGIILGRYYKSSHTDNMFYIYPRTDKLTNILNFVARDYVDPVSKDELVERAIPKILAELDPHSQYLPASELESVNEPLEGKFSGIGVQFNMLNDTLVVLKTIANGPSEKIGILAGDRILIVDGDTVAGKNMPSDSIVKRLKGPRSTIVQVGIQRRLVKELLFFSITRDEIPLYSMDVAYSPRPGIGYMKLNTFSSTTFQEFTEGITQLIGLGMQSLILDLRGNGGGYMEPAIQIADQFLGGEELIVYTEGHARPRQEYRSTRGGLCSDLKLIILIDEGSASASEILAGAIQDNDRGTIVGRRSFGKGLVQQQNEFPDGSAIRLTIARYYSPTGRCIQKPYTNGNEEKYYMELSDRYLHGELSEIDSIKFDDSLKYTTPGGKTVYGGGGIMPDIFTPIDTTGFTNYLMELRNRGLIYRFALQYSDSHRKDLDQLNSLAEFNSYLNRKKAFNHFINFAAENGVPVNKQEIAISEKILRVQLYAYIIRNTSLDNKGFYPAIESIDNTLVQAINLLDDNHKVQ